MSSLLALPFLRGKLPVLQHPRQPANIRSVLADDGPEVRHRRHDILRQSQINPGFDCHAHGRAVRKWRNLHNCRGLIGGRCLGRGWGRITLLRRRSVALLRRWLAGGLRLGNFNLGRPLILAGDRVFLVISDPVGWSRLFMVRSAVGAVSKSDDGAVHRSVFPVWGSEGAGGGYVGDF